jgi:hypothetical protein
MSDQQAEFVKRLEALDLPLHDKVQAFFNGTCALSALLEQSIVPVIQGMVSRSEFEDAIAGTMYRIAVWLKSLERLDHPIDIQPVFAGARSIFELVLDIKLLIVDPPSAPKFRAFVFVERFRAAKGLVDYLDKLPGGAAKADAQRTFVGNPANQQKLEVLCKQCGWWDASKNKPKRLDHWSGKNMADRSRDAGIQYEELYKSYYPQLSWNVHAGAVGVLGISPAGFESAFAVAHGIIQDLGYDAAEDVGTVFKLFDADPDLRAKIKAAKQVAAQTLLDTSIKVLQEQEESGTR